MASVGPNIAGSGTDDASIGTQSWASPGNITVVDNAFAIASLGGSAISHYLRSGSHGLTLTGNVASIDGIFAEALVKSQSGIAKDSSVKLAKGATIVGTNKAAALAISTTLTWLGYGGPLDTWGVTWTQADVQATGFGMAYAITSTTLDTVSVDAMRITVYYSVASDIDPALMENATSTVRFTLPSVGRRATAAYLMTSGIPPPDSDNDANMINHRVMIWNP